MSKQWNLWGTNALGYGEPKETRAEKIRREHAFTKAIRHVPTMTYDELKAKAEANNEAAIANNKQLIDAYNAKKLKSKSLIKRAKNLIKAEQKKAEAKAKKKKAEAVATA